jgi:hypothetical protein
MDVSKVKATHALVDGFLAEWVKAGPMPASQQVS